MERCAVTTRTAFSHINVWGLFARREEFGARPPFDLPANWIAKRSELALGTLLNFVSTIDITGGSSGSPMVNVEGELVGLIFDRNLEGHLPQPLVGNGRTYIFLTAAVSGLPRSAALALKNSSEEDLADRG